MSWLQGMEAPEEVSLGDGTLGTKMVRPQEKEKITQEVWKPSFLEIPAYVNFTILTVASQAFSFLMFPSVSVM